MLKEVYIAGGCFWGVEAYFRKIKGVKETEVGYANGQAKIVNYQTVCQNSGHVEVVKIVFDLAILSWDNFFMLYMYIINPFSKNRQGNDIGVQYRVGLYSKNNLDLQILKNLLTTWEDSHQKTIVEILLIENYTKAELEHQNYLQKNPQGYCHINLTDIPKKFLK